MAGEIPLLELPEFSDRLADLTPVPLSPESIRALYAHFLELRRWNRLVSLIGSGTAKNVMTRHYGESLKALPLLRGSGRLVDLGSGAGFPGFVLAAALPGLQAYLVEARQKKWAFLVSAARRAGVECRCLQLRVTIPLPSQLPAPVDYVTLRAVRFSPRELTALAGGLTPGGRLLLWAASSVEPPPGLVLDGQVPLPGSRSRQILVFRPTLGPTPGPTLGTTGPSGSPTDSRGG